MISIMAVLTVAGKTVSALLWLVGQRNGKGIN